MEGHQAIVITISRQIASGGTYLGQTVAKRLGFRYVDTDVLQEAAKYFGVEEKELLLYEEKALGFWEKILKAFAFGSREYVPPSRPPVYDRDLFEVEAKIITDIASKCNVVIMGRGGFHILRKHPGLINVFCHAPMSFRIKRMMEVYSIPDRDRARSEIEESDRRREKFIRTMTGVEWTDARNYHLCINTGMVSFEIAEETIVRVVEDLKQNLGL